MGKKSRKTLKASDTTQLLLASSTTLVDCCAGDQNTTAERLAELLDSVRCRPVLERLKRAGYSEHVAQVGALQIAMLGERRMRLAAGCCSAAALQVNRLLPLLDGVCSGPAWRCTRLNGR
jgi:hypothetical protein